MMYSTMNRHKVLINNVFSAAAIASYLLLDRVDDDKEYKYWNFWNLIHPNSYYKNACCRCESDARTEKANASSSSGVMETSPTESPYINTVAASAPSKFRRALAHFNLMELPTPRLLIPNDPVFSHPSLRRGLRQRRLDEIQLKSLEKEAMDAASTGDPQHIAKVVTKMCEIAYGNGVTPQDRQDFLIKFGCAAWSDEALSLICNLCKDRGIVEIGAGNGQWARAITDYYVRQFGGNAATNNSSQQQRPPNFEFVMAFDDCSSLPLSPAIYHSRTKPARDHFYPNIRKADYSTALSSLDTQNRVLLLVYPPPGPLASLTVKKYTSRRWNDIVIYVGEGRDGANADHSFFSMLEDESWMLLHFMDLPPSVGCKGYEKLYVFKKVHSSLSHDEFNMNQVLRYRN